MSDLQRLHMNSNGSVAVTHTSETAIKMEEAGQKTAARQFLCITMKNWIILTKGIHAFQRGLLVKLARCIASDSA